MTTRMSVFAALAAVTCVLSAATLPACDRKSTTSGTTSVAHAATTAAAKPSVPLPAHPAPAAAASHGAHEWGYSAADGPEHWGTLKSEYATCDTGKTQSPIDFPTPDNTSE